MLFDKVMFLGEMETFKGTSGLSLSFLADIAEERLITPNQSMALDERSNNHFYIVYQGTVNYYLNGEQKAAYSPGQFLGEMLSLPGFAQSNILQATEKSVLLKINKDLLYELLAENVKLADRVLEYV